MKYEELKNGMDGYKVIDLRGIAGNFFNGIKKQAENIKIKEGFEIIQNFEPFPLYKVMEGLGFVYGVKEMEKNEFHILFQRVEVKESEDKVPFKPIALLNYPIIDKDLGKIALDFWKNTWDSENRTIPFEMRLLLSLTNAVGAGRMRQAARELIKAYSCGVTIEMLDDVFELIAWNQGIGFFSSEVGPSILFKSYKMIKTLEKQNKDRQEIVEILIEKFGEKNPEISVG